MENVKKLEGGSNLGALREIGQNKERTIGMCVDKKKGEAWKRRTRMNEMNEGKKDEKGNENSEVRISNKRGFSLRDDEELEEADEQNGKKDKHGMKEMNMCENLVEVTSQKWHHSD